jgi:hypothetical protein
MAARASFVAGSTIWLLLAAQLSKDILSLLEEGRVMNSLETVRKLLSGTETAQECPLVRVRMVPARLDGVYFCRALGPHKTPKEEPAVACCPQELVFGP